MTKKLTINKKMCKIMSEVPAEIKKDLHNSFADYWYASSDAVYKAMRPLLAKYDLGVDFNTEVIRETIEISNKKGDIEKKVLQSMKVSIRLGDDKFTHITMPIIQNSPQGFQSAITFAIKYFLRSKFLLVTGEKDADKDATPDSHAAQNSNNSKPKYSLVKIEVDKDNKIQFSDGEKWDNPAWVNDALSHLYLLIRRKMEDSDGETIQELVDVNIELIKEIPEKGLIALSKLAVKKSLEINFPEPDSDPDPATEPED